MMERPTQPELLREASASDKAGPVTCLGLTFADEAERRAYFTARLREYLQDPTFRAIEGFPLGTDEDILALSDPPYYTACPNPFLSHLIGSDPLNRQAEQLYNVRPYTGELSASRNNPFVNAHSYATKVPHEIVLRLILHYTSPGDLILDTFGGTGMSAVAAQFCGDSKFLSTLGFYLTSEGKLVDSDGNYYNDLGARHAIIGDLSPAATFIAANFNLPLEQDVFDDEVKQMLQALDESTAWMYKTKHVNGEPAELIATIWSDVYICTSCGQEFSFWDGAVSIELGKVEDDVTCTRCNSKTSKDRLDRVWVSKFDSALNSVVRQFKQIPVLLVYEFEGHRYQKQPDAEDLQILDAIEEYLIQDWYPVVRMPDGDESRRNDPLGITHVHHFFSKRNLAALACAWKNAHSSRSRFMLTSLMYKSSILCAPLMSNFFAEKRGEPRGGWIGKERSGTLYCPSIHSEVSIRSQIRSRWKSVGVTAATKNLPFITTSSATKLSLSDNCIDYVFTDPPFGANKMYSELNFIWESWLKVITNNQKEAIINKTQRKGIPDYEALMRQSFSEYYRVLKPGRWITVEFSNTSASVWNALQNALGTAGFIVADVRSLNKQQGSILGYTTSTAARVDLAITAYKPTSRLEEQFLLEVGTTEGAWNFVRSHLAQLPVSLLKDGKFVMVSERFGYTLFDKTVAFYVQRGRSIPLSASEFHQGLAQYFIPRDGMYFLPEQVAEYDKQKLLADEVVQFSIIGRYARSK
jgi:DNA-directed RNA polymerase subunit RPC12/RpoP